MSEMSFEIWSLVNKVQELSVTVGWLQRENAQAKVVIDRLLSAEAGEDLMFACKVAREFLTGSKAEE